jgi:hypothetical protein
MLALAVRQPRNAKKKKKQKKIEKPREKPNKKTLLANFETAGRSSATRCFFPASLSLLYFALFCFVFEMHSAAPTTLHRTPSIVRFV